MSTLRNRVHEPYAPVVGFLLIALQSIGESRLWKIDVSRLDGRAGEVPYSGCRGRRFESSRGRHCIDATINLVISAAKFVEADITELSDDCVQVELGLMSTLERIEAPSPDLVLTVVHAGDRRWVAYSFSPIQQSELGLAPGDEHPTGASLDQARAQ